MRARKVLFLGLATLSFAVIAGVVLVFFNKYSKRIANGTPVEEKTLGAGEDRISEDVSEHGGHGNSPPQPPIQRPRYESVEDLPASLRWRIEELHGAKDRVFTPLDGIVDDFSVSEFCVPEAVAQLSNDFNVLCGVEVVPWPRDREASLTPFRRVSLSMQQTSPRQILDKLVSMDPNFIWFEDQGVVNVVLLRSYESPDYPLNRWIAQFQVEDRPFTRVFFAPRGALFGLPEVRESLVFGGAARWPLEFEPRVSVDAIDSTPRQIINQVAQELGMSWTVISRSGAKTVNGKPRASFRMYTEMPLCGYYD